MVDQEEVREEDGSSQNEDVELDLWLLDMIPHLQEFVGSGIDHRKIKEFRLRQYGHVIRRPPSMTVSRVSKL